MAPFIGFGVLGQAPGGIDALTSVHVGVELELARDFSLAFTFVVRRERGLRDGYAPGSPVALGTQSDQFTTLKAIPAFGVILNASPSLLQFATSSKDGK